jgi:hypothetical protein
MAGPMIPPRRAGQASRELAAQHEQNQHDQWVRGVALSVAQQRLGRALPTLAEVCAHADQLAEYIRTGRVPVDPEGEQ